MNDGIVLLTKDAQSCSYYPTYGNKTWSTPNLDELAHKGTVFQCHYTAAPSTAMAFSAMFTGKYPYEFNRKKYIPVSDDVKQEDTLFGWFERQNGRRCHIIWDEHFDSFALPYANCFGPNTKIHSIHIAQKIGPHANGNALIRNNDEVAEEMLLRLFNEIDSIIAEGSSFLWIHLPHVLLGRSCYGGDIDLVDKIVGYLRKRYDDNNIFFSADHGNMNGQKGKLCYGFDVYQEAVHIPFIAPKIQNLSIVDWNTSNVDLISILKDRMVPQREYLIIDDAYYAQPNRKLGILYKNFKYIYNKRNRTEELYDISYDPNENFNLLKDCFYDKDRQVNYRTDQLYYYPNWDLAFSALEKCRAEKQRIWTEESRSEHIIEILKDIYRTQKKRIISNRKIRKVKSNQ